MRVPHRHWPYDGVKRALDIALSTAGVVATAPLQLVVAGVVWRTMGRPILFRQPRPGEGEAVFVLVKFRTMLEPDETHRTDAERLTRVGRFLRSTSLDELPTLWNVLVGDMSLVGPRPLLVEYLDRYTPEQARRHEVRPGITGLAQVSGRNGLSWEKKLQLDAEYVDRRSMALDISILLRTIGTVLAHQGVNEPGRATMTQFPGSQGNAGRANADHVDRTQKD